jgi:hypothetical protein
MRAAAPRAAFDFLGTLSMVLPGSGQLVRGEVALGLFFMTSLAFLAAFGWALVGTLDRLTPTLRLLEVPGSAGVWALCAVYFTAALLHLANVLKADPHSGHMEPAALHPVVTGLASAVVPGWGQILNGSYKRACLFLGSLWLVGATWIVASPEIQANLESLRIYVPSQILMLCVPAVRWTAPAVIWALAVYDAAATASARR